MPVVLVAIVLVLRVVGPGARADAGRIPLLPWFMLLFLALVTLGSVVVANAL